MVLACLAGFGTNNVSVWEGGLQVTVFFTALSGLLVHTASERLAILQGCIRT